MQRDGARAGYCSAVLCYVVYMYIVHAYVCTGLKGSLIGLVWCGLGWCMLFEAPWQHYHITTAPNSHPANPGLENHLMCGGALINHTLSMQSLHHYFTLCMCTHVGPLPMRFTTLTDLHLWCKLPSEVSRFSLVTSASTKYKVL